MALFIGCPTFHSIAVAMAVRGGLHPEEAREMLSPSSCP